MTLPDVPEDLWIQDQQSLFNQTADDIEQENTRRLAEEERRKKQEDEARIREMMPKFEPPTRDDWARMNQQPYVLTAADDKPSIPSPNIVQPDMPSAPTLGGSADMNPEYFHPGSILNPEDNPDMRGNTQNPLYQQDQSEFEQEQNPNRIAMQPDPNLPPMNDSRDFFAFANNLIDNINPIKATPAYAAANESPEATALRHAPDMQSGGDYTDELSQAAAETKPLSSQVPVNETPEETMQRHGTDEQSPPQSTDMVGQVRDALAQLLGLQQPSGNASVQRGQPISGADDIFQEVDNNRRPGTLTIAPGTSEPIQNEDGSVTTERSITVEDPQLNDGKPTNIPSVWNGQIVSDNEAIQNAISSGIQFPSFETTEDAVAAAQARSDALGRGDEISIGGASGRNNGIQQRPGLSPDASIIGPQGEGFQVGSKTYTPSVQGLGEALGEVGRGIEQGTEVYEKQKYAEGDEEKYRQFADNNPMPYPIRAATAGVGTAMKTAYEDFGGFVSDRARELGVPSTEEGVGFSVGPVHVGPAEALGFAAGIANPLGDIGKLNNISRRIPLNALGKIDREAALQSVAEARNILFGQIQDSGIQKELLDAADAVMTNRSLSGMSDAYDNFMGLVSKYAPQAEAKAQETIQDVGQTAERAVSNAARRTESNMAEGVGQTVDDLGNELGDVGEAAARSSQGAFNDRNAELTNFRGIGRWDAEEMPESTRTLYEDIRANLDRRGPITLQQQAEELAPKLGKDAATIIKEWTADGKGANSGEDATEMLIVNRAIDVLGQRISDNEQKVLSATGQEALGLRQKIFDDKLALVQTIAAASGRAGEHARALNMVRYAGQLDNVETNITSARGVANQIKTIAKGIRRAARTGQLDDNLRDQLDGLVNVLSKDTKEELVGDTSALGEASAQAGRRARGETTGDTSEAATRARRQAREKPETPAEQAINENEQASGTARQIAELDKQIEDLQKTIDTPYEGVSVPEAPQQLYDLRTERNLLMKQLQEELRAGRTEAAAGRAAKMGEKEAGDLSEEEILQALENRANREAARNVDEQLSGKARENELLRQHRQADQAIDQAKRTGDTEALATAEASKKEAQAELDKLYRPEIEAARGKEGKPLSPEAYRKLLENRIRSNIKRGIKNEISPEEEFYQEVGKAKTIFDKEFANDTIATIDALTKAGGNTQATREIAVDLLNKLVGGTGKYTATAEKGINYNAAITPIPGGRSASGYAEMAVRKYMAQKQMAELRRIMPKDFKITDQIRRDIESLDFTDPRSIVNFARSTSQADPATFLEKVHAGRIASMLTGTATLANIIGGGLMPLARVGLERPGAALAEALATRGGRTRARTSTFGDVGAEVGGFLNGFAPALKEFQNTWKTGISLNNLRDVGGRTNALEQIQTKGLKQAAQPLSKVFRFMAATDDMFYTLNHAMILQAEANRVANTTGKSVSEVFSDLTQHPEILTRTREKALRAVLQQPLTGAFAGLGRARSKSDVMRVIIPFLNTNVNIAKIGAAEYNPAIALGHAAWKYREGDAFTAADKAGYGVAGATLAALGMGLGYTGIVNALGSDNPRVRQMVSEGTGKEGGSINIGGQAVNLGFLGPFAAPIVGGALIGEAWKQGELNDKQAQDMMSRMTTAFGHWAGGTGTLAQNMLGLRNLSDAINIVDKPAQSLGRFTGGIAATFIPYGGAFSVLQKATDNSVRDPHGSIEYLINNMNSGGSFMLPRGGMGGVLSDIGDSSLYGVAGRLPFISKALPEERAALGETRPQTTGASARIPGSTVDMPLPNPVRMQQIRDERIYNLLQAADIGIGDAPTSIAVPNAPGSRINITKQEQEVYQQAFGDQMRKMVNYGLEKNGSVSEKALRNAMQIAREAAEAAVIKYGAQRNSPELRGRFIQGVKDYRAEQIDQRRPLP